MGLVSELRRRNVFRVAIAYVIIAWLILQVGDTLAPALHLDERVNTVLAFFLILGFPIALVFAWAFEITPEGLKKERDVNRTESITHITGWKLDYFIIAVLAVALGFFAFDKFILAPSRDAELVRTTTEAVTEQAAESADNSIAVLAFTDLSPEGDQEYFSDGISEELLNVLAKIPGLRVAARTSSFQFKGENRDAINIGQQLNVGLVLEGSVRKAGLQVRITAQLIDASNGFHLWSETYDRELKNIFAVQDEISAAIVGALKKHLSVQVEAAPRVTQVANTEAHEAYLRGRYLVVQLTRASIESAITEFEKAIALDPDFALAHAELAMSIGYLWTWGGDMTITELVAKAAPHAEKAMALSPALAEAYAATGFVLDYQWKYEEALTHYRQSIQINPNYSVVYNWMGTILGLNLGRYAEGLAAYETALRLDPLSIHNVSVNIRALIDRNRLEEAERELEKLAPIAPAEYATLRGYLTSLDGNWANRVLALLDTLRLDPESGQHGLTRAFAAIGLDKEALAPYELPKPEVLRMIGRPGVAVTIAEARLADDSASFRTRRDLGMALASAGDYARARPILEEMWQRSGGRVVRYGWFEAENAAALIVIRRAADEESGIGELVAAIEDDVRRQREAGITVVNLRYRTSADYQEGLATYLSGEHERGLALIAKAVDDGFFIMPNEAYLQVLYDDPGFAPIRAGQEARQTRERKKFLDIVCTDNPYEAVWKPAEGTCEKFVPAEGW